MEYRVDDQELETSVFLSFVNKIWPGNYDVDKTRAALAKTFSGSAKSDKQATGIVVFSSCEFGFPHIFATAYPFSCHTNGKKVGLFFQSANHGPRVNFSSLISSNSLP